MRPRSVRGSQYVFKEIAQEDQHTKSCRQHKFRALVARDAIVVFALLQMVVVSLGVLVWLFDGAQSLELPEYPIMPDCPRDSIMAATVGCTRRIKMFYYVCGLANFFALLGLYGACAMPPHPTLARAPRTHAHSCIPHAVAASGHSVLALP